MAVIRVKHPQDFCAGLLFVAFGCTALWIGRDYAAGTIMKMGPGYLPRILSWALVGIGAFLVGRALIVAGPGIDGSRVRPQFFILLAIVVFALTIERFGLAPSVLVVTMIAAIASHEMKWMETITMAIILSGVSVLLFIYALSQSMEMWTWNF